MTVKDHIDNIDHLFSCLTTSSKLLPEVKDSGIVVNLIAIFT